VTGSNLLGFVPLPGAERLVALHASELPQKDELCGAFWGLLALRTARVADYESIDQDAVARAAGSVLSAEPAGPLPPGEPGRNDYRLRFPTVEDSANSGTSVRGLVRALEGLSGEQLAALPVAGPWDITAVEALLDAVSSCAQPCTLIANVGTRYLWGSRSSPPTLLAYLTSGDPGPGPPPDWDVGHFVGVLGRVAGPRGTLVVVADSYRSLGWEGLHLQPIERISNALARPESAHPSGLIMVAAAEEGPRIQSALLGAGLEIRAWDNGTPDVVNAG
jgi:hypothetical protein